MTVKDFKEMINRVVFCAEDGLTLLTPDRENVYLEFSQGKLVMASRNILPFYRLGAASFDVGETWPDIAVYMRAAFLWEFARTEEAKPLKLKLFPTPSEWAFIKEKRSMETEPLRFFDAGGGNVYLNIGSSGILIERPAFSPAKDCQSVRFCHYPEYFSEVFPASFSVDRLALLEALGMLSSIVDPRFSCMLYIRLSAGRMVLRIFDFDDSAKAEIPCDYSGEETRLTFEVKLFRETIEHVDTERVNIRFCMRDADAAILPVRPANSAAPKHGYFFILTQRIKWGTNDGR